MNFDEWWAENAEKFGGGVRYKWAAGEAWRAGAGEALRAAAREMYAKGLAESKSNNRATPLAEILTPHSQWRSK